MPYTWDSFNALVRSNAGDLVPDSTTIAPALVEYVRWNVARDQTRDLTEASSMLASWKSYKKRMLGYDFDVYSQAAAQTDTKALLSGNQQGRDGYVLAVADFIKAELEESERTTSLRNTYVRRKLGLAGYTVADTAEQLYPDVTKVLSPIAGTYDTLIQAITLFVKGELARLIERDTGRYQSFNQDYNQLRFRLLGFSTEELGSPPSDAQVEDDVRDRLGSDAARIGAQDMINDLIRTARQQIKDFKDTTMSLTSAAREDLNHYGSWIDNVIERGCADLKGLHVFVENHIRQVVIDLQRYVPAYRMGHETLYGQDDVVADCYASRGSLPEGAKPLQAYILYEDEDAPCDACVECELISDYGFFDYGQTAISTDDCIPRLIIDPKGGLFIAKPQLSTEKGISLRLHWDGTKLDFDGADSVPFDEGAVYAAAAWVNAEVSREFGSSLGIFNSFRDSYLRTRRRLFVSLKEREMLAR